MTPRERLTCACGGEIRPPIPVRCPHCGATITGVRRSRLVPLLRAVVVVALLAALVAFLGWWVP